MTAASKDADWTELMRAALAGDAGAYLQFLLAITPYIRAVARKRCAPYAGDGEAEDVVQEVLLAIHLKRGTWDPSRSIGPWIGAIIRNKIIDAFRRRGRRRIDVPIEDVIDILPATEQTPEISASEIDALLGQLKVPRRQIVQSISLDGKSIQETAARLRMSEGAVRVSLHRALKTLGTLYRRGTDED
jgi:RNA polymerase sigma-70 factor (ECF subfamily)